MGKHTTLTWLALGAVVAACGAGGGGGAGSSGSGSPSNAFGTIRLLQHHPADGALQVAVDTSITLEFDGAIARDSLADADTWLRIDGTDTNVSGTFSVASNGRVLWKPAAPLALETDYTFQVAALTCDLDGRILDVERRFSFRTLDTTPPTLLAVDVAPNSSGVERTRSFTFTFSETLAASSVNAQSLYLRDVYGTRYAANCRVDGHAVRLDPFADLPGDRQFSLVATTLLTDRAGNALTAASTTGFRTAADGDAPAVIGVWPATYATGVSPAVQPTFRFTESMDPATVEAASLLFQDQFGSVVPFRIHASPDQRFLRLEPQTLLAENRQYTLAFLLGGAAATDVSGNGLAATQALVFTTGTDASPPTLATSDPVGGQTRVSHNATPSLTFAEALDAAWIDEDTVTLTVDGAPWAAVVDLAGAGRTVRVTPVLALPVRAVCTVAVRGGHEGARDLAGNVLPADVAVTFTTSDDAALPRVMLQPGDGSTQVSTSARVSLVFDAPVDPSTVDATTIQVTDDAAQPIAGTLELRVGNRVVLFTPAQALQQLTYHRVRVVGGSQGVRKVSGNWFAADQTARWKTGSWTDVVAPVVNARLNGIDPSRSAGLVLPPSGFSIDVTVTDGGTQSVDMGSVEVDLSGPAAAPGPAALLASATIDHGTARILVPASPALAEGEWTLTVRARDLSGNVGVAPPRGFTVAPPTGTLLPFERTQVVWVRGDLDRDGNGIDDFGDDMLRLGFATAGDPLGTNARVRDLVLDGILAQANRLYGRGDRGEPLDGGSVGLRFARREPYALPHMQIALGGLDPEGDKRRGYGAESTGILGRAYYDYRNGNVAERNTSNSPGLGVFPGEMWLYQARIHEQVWPSFQTVFAQRFRPLCPSMGGTPAGSHPLDAIVLAPGFDETTATGAELARWLTIVSAADDWATVTGIVLAHEVGHSVGLVAPGPAPSGLFGDSSLHDTYAGAAEVMAPAVGYEAMTTLDYAFRDIDLAYLRQRILLR